MAYQKKFKPDFAQMAIGAGVLFALLVLPVVSGPTGQLVVTVRDALSGSKNA